MFFKSKQESKQDSPAAQALAGLVDPETGSRLASRVTVEGGRTVVEVTVGYPVRGHDEPLRRLVAEALRGVADDAEIRVASRVTAHAVQRGMTPLPGVRNIVAIASGKGGVGKSTTAANLALALAAAGASVGLLDADIYGPSQQMMMGLSGQPESLDGKIMQPMRAHGVQVMSIGVLLDPDQPMIWRGPMATQALEQLLRQTAWQDLDYLLVDLPPGTGDIQLTLSQRVPLTGAVIVTTPQDIALLDARKGLKMFEKVQVPVLGIVENMAVHVCSNCGHAEHIFGAGGGAAMAADYGVDLLGSLPLDLHIREQADSGHPSVVADPEGAASREYAAIAHRLAVKIAQRAKDYSDRFPTIKVTET